MNRPPTDKRLRLADALRIFAALWVLSFHLSYQIKLFFAPPAVVGTFFSFGYMGVDLLFILSGFLIAYHHEDRLRDAASYRRFLRDRLIRLYPLHGFILLCMAAIVLSAQRLHIPVNTPADFTVGKFVAQIFLVSAWSFPAQMSWNYFAWAVSALWLMYLLTPLLFAVLRKLQKRSYRIALLALLTAVMPAIMLLSPQTSVVAYALPRVFSGYCYGILLHALLRENLSPQHYSTSKTLHYAADMTYALYITQYPVLLFVKKILPMTAITHQNLSVQMTYVIGEIALCLAAAVLAHHLIEKPARRFLASRH